MRLGRSGSAIPGPLDEAVPAPRFAALRRSLRALRNRSYRIFATGLVISTVGSWMQMMAQSWLVLELTDSGKALGLVFALQTLPMLLIGAFAGVIADRVDNHRLLAWTSFGGVVQASSLGVMQATGHITVGWIYAFALGMVSAFDRPAMQALVYELAGPDDLSSAIGLGSTINNTGRLLGPSLAGVLLATAGMATVFFLNAATYAALIVCLLALRHAPRFARIGTGARANLRDGFRYVWGDPTLRLAMLVMFVIGTFAYNFGALVPAMVHFEFHASALAVGLVQAVGGVGAILGGLFAGSLHRPTTRLLGIVATCFGLAVFASALAPSVAVFTIVWLPLGLASAIFTTVDQTLLQRESAPEYQGRVMSLFAVAWMGTTPIGGLIAGTIVDQWSARAAIGFGGVMAILAGLGALAYASTRVRPEVELATSAGAPLAGRTGEVRA